MYGWADLWSKKKPIRTAGKRPSPISASCRSRAERLRNPAYCSIACPFLARSAKCRLGGGVLLADLEERLGLADEALNLAEQAASAPAALIAVASSVAGKGVRLA